jgi:hypothetical protein
MRLLSSLLILILIVGPTSPRFCGSLRWWGRTLEEISQGHGTSISVKVRRFIPQPDDRLEYRWIPNGTPRPYGFANIEQPGSVQLAMPPYAIANIKETTAAFQIYIESNVLTYLDRVVCKSEPITFRTLHMAYRYSQTYSVRHFLMYRYEISVIKLLTPLGQDIARLFKILDGLPLS